MDAAKTRIHQGLQGHADDQNVLVPESVQWASNQARL